MGSGEEGVEESEAVDEMEQEKRTRAIVSQETANILSGLGKLLNFSFFYQKVLLFSLTGTGPLDVRIKRLAGQRDDLQDTVRRLKLDLEEERSRSSLARGAASQEELERWRHHFPIFASVSCFLNCCNQLFSGKQRNS